VRGHDDEGARALNDGPRVHKYSVLTMGRTIPVE